MTRSVRRVPPLVWILAAGVLVRAALLVYFHHQPLEVWDEREYNELAVNLAARGQFALDGQIGSMRPPLYPAVVAGIYKLCGLENYQAVRAFQALTDLMTAAVLLLLGTEVYDRRIGAWAAALYAFYPSGLAQANLLLSETLFTFWLLLSCLVVVRALRSGLIGMLALAGAVIGLAALTRSVVWLFPPVLAVYVLLAWRTNLWRRLAGAGLMLAFFAITVAPWSIRCTRLEKTLVVIDAIGGRNFMMGNYEHTPLYRSWDAISIDGEQAWYRVLARANPGFRNLTQGQRDKLALRYGLRFVWDHPWLTLQRDAVKLVNFWQMERATIAGLARGFWGNLSTPLVVAAAIVILGFYVAAMLSGIFGATVAAPADRRVHGFLLLLIAFVWGLHALVFAHSRYHLPLMPIVFVYSASALVNGRSIWQRRSRLAFWLATGSAAMLVGAWVWEVIVVDYQRVADLLGL